MRIRANTIAVLMVCIAVSHGAAQISSHIAPDRTPSPPRSAQYEQVQQRLALGWNTWDVRSVATQVLLPEGLAIHVGMKHNTSLNGDAFLGDALIGRLDKDAEVVTPGPHAWAVSEVITMRTYGNNSLRSRMSFFYVNGARMDTCTRTTARSQGRAAT